MSQFAEQKQMSDIRIPKFFATGDFVLSSIFNLPPPQHADVVVHSDQIRPANEIRQMLSLPDDCSVSVSSELPSFAFNTDFWVQVPLRGLVTLDSRHPIGRELRVISLESAEDAFRLLTVAASFPWESLPLVEIGKALALAEDLVRTDPSSAELLAYKHFDASAELLLEHARGLVMIGNIKWDDFNRLKPAARSQYLRDESGALGSLIYTQQFDRALLDRLFSVAELIRGFQDDPAMLKYLKTILATKSCVLYFPQCSTRTFTSFSLAAQALGMIVEEIRDPEMSAMYKGESELDTLITLATLSDVVVLRQMNNELTDLFAYEVKVRGLGTRVINGGSGADQHPTQALLDLYTLAAHLDLDSEDSDLSVAFVGDLKRSRTARSLSYLLALYPRVKHVFVAPEELQMKEDLLEYLEERGVSYTCTESFETVVESADAFYMMRIQDEYSTTSESTRNKYTEYHLTVERLAKMKPSAHILHPLPRRTEVPIEVDYDPRARYWEAVLRGKLVRMALLLHMFDRDDVDSIRQRLYD